jgi:3-hydroxybutyryl-CoA dehydrogenase
LEDIDYVIENVVEKWEIKKSVYRQLDQLCRDDAIFAVNTSAISITRIASVTKRADDKQIFLFPIFQRHFQ